MEGEMKAPTIHGSSRNHALLPFAKGARVQLHPSTSYWMQGDRYGTIERVGTHYLFIRMDKSGKLIQVIPSSILEIIS